MTVGLNSAFSPTWRRIVVAVAIVAPVFTVGAQTKADDMAQERLSGKNTKKNTSTKIEGKRPDLHLRPSSVPPVLPLPNRQSENPLPSDETVIVTGTRSANHRARESSSPISILTSAELEHSGMMNLADAITRVYPSINIGALGIDTASLTSSVQMRGLNPNEVLILVDGKRRHTTANIVQNPGPQFGSTGVDLNMLPANAIDHIEILEDGAAAQYGSDAIAGVVNIITKKTDHGLNVSTQTGANAYNGDGWRYQLNADGGTKIGQDGYLHISGQIYHTDHMVVQTKDHRLIGDWPYNATTTGYYNGVVKNAIALPLNSNKAMSSPEETRENLSITFGKEITPGLDAYGVITYAHRHAEQFANFRIPSIAPSLFPSGFTPIETDEENDYAATIGIKKDHFLGFHWDISTTYGADENKIGVKDTVNVGMLGSSCTTDSSGHSSYFSSDGCGWSPTSVLAQTYRLAQWTNNLDLRRNFNIAKVVPATLSFGAEHRLETYQIKAGNPPSYEAGGTQGYGGVSPQRAGSWSRDVWAAYVDSDFHFTKKWTADFAGRFEHYTDTGNTETGKISTRYEFSRAVALRGTISTGFRAPTLPEEHYSNISIHPNGASGLLPVNSQSAKILGASPLKPERSVSESGGIVLAPLPNFHIEADVYQVNLRDRIVQGGTVTGMLAENAIENMGFSFPSASEIDPSAVSAYYLSNGASTRTQGLDIKSDYTIHSQRYGTLLLSLALDLNRTRLHHNGIGSNGQELLNAQTIGYLTTSFPKSKIILNAQYNIGNWDMNVRQTRYGETTNMLSYMDWTDKTATCPSGGLLYGSTSCFAQFKNTPRWLTDIEVGYRVKKNWHFAIGADNIFNIRPRKVPQTNNNRGVFVYDQFSSQVPITGGYYYGRINATF